MPIIKTIARIRLLIEVVLANGTAESRRAVWVATISSGGHARLAGELPVAALYAGS
jgi:hypothetical protein